MPSIEATGKTQRDRLVIFGDPNFGFAGILLASFLHELKSRNDIEVVAVCDTARKAPLKEPWRGLVSRFRFLAQKAFNPSIGRLSVTPSAQRLYKVALRSSVPVIVPAARNVNSPQFIATLRNEFRPTLALSVGCLQIFKPPLLDAFEMAVNYHDGYLPFYKGISATAWSVYHRETYTGYSYHLMDRGIDSGPVLAQDRIPIRSGPTAAEVRREKTERAARDAKRVLDLMVARASGTPQAEPGSHFSAADYRRICTINPAQVSSEEIRHRLRCFEILNLPIRGRLCEVTELRETKSRDSFTTADGVALAPHRMLWLPPWLYRLYRRR